MTVRGSDIKVGQTVHYFGEPMRILSAQLSRDTSPGWPEGIWEYMCRTKTGYKPLQFHQLDEAAPRLAELGVPAYAG